MASFTASSVNISSVSCSFKRNQVSNLRKASLSFGGKGFLNWKRPALHFRVACATKPETVNKVCEIVRKQLALPADRDVTGDSTFATLGADSLDTVILRSKLLGRDSDGARGGIRDKRRGRKRPEYHHRSRCCRSHRETHAEKLTSLEGDIKKGSLLRKLLSNSRPLEIPI